MTTTATRQPSIKQMAARSLDGHLIALRALADGKPCVGPTDSPGTIRGMRTVLGTLRRWDAVDSEANLTTRGAELLDVLEERRAKSIGWKRTPGKVFQCPACASSHMESEDCLPGEF